MRICWSYDGPLLGGSSGASSAKGRGVRIIKDNSLRPFALNLIQMTWHKIGKVVIPLLKEMLQQPSALFFWDARTEAIFAQDWEDSAVPHNAQHLEDFCSEHGITIVIRYDENTGIDDVTLVAPVSPSFP